MRRTSRCSGFDERQWRVVLGEPFSFGDALRSPAATLRSAYRSLVLRRSGRPFPPSLTHSTVVLYYWCIPSTSLPASSSLPRLSTSLSPSDPPPSIHHSIYTGIVVLYKLLAGKIYAPSYSDIHTYSDIRTYRTAPEPNQKQEVKQAPASHPAAQFKAGREAGAGAISPCAGVEGCRGSTTAPG